MKKRNFYRSAINQAISNGDSQTASNIEDAWYDVATGLYTLKTELEELSEELRYEPLDGRGDGDIVEQVQSVDDELEVIAKCIREFDKSKIEL